MKNFELPRISLIWLGIGVVFWFIIGLLTLNDQGFTWKAMLTFALAAACLAGVILGTLAKKRNIRD
ncbi:hypothetical protein AL755_03530 (plasmid) [Arthrobacter sp. ERGS1:01]|uniref:hypothetical protein n=1 Tax=Arthrobacter sp. ERGS1:01 TaxID=1704044 RepID=UPI0006B41D99|nr:hypothetical protein [Arthrobacter sp. ERGS1:01]ALE04771.1 hypothetical protein AL755_03530 [Arthrobacter sp. ERGS1:01]